MIKKPEILSDEELMGIYPPPGSDEYPEWDICEGCPFPLMAREAQRDADWKEMLGQMDEVTKNLYEMLLVEKGINLKTPIMEYLLRVRQALQRQLSYEERK